MSAKKRVTQFIKKATRTSLGRIYPFSKVYQKFDHWRHKVDELEERVNALQARNDEWAAEVRSLRGEDKRQEIVWPAEPELISTVVPVTQHKKTFGAQKPSVVLVIPPADPGSGGHTTIFRFVTHLERKGYPVELFVYDPLQRKKPGEATQIIRDFWSHMKAPIHEGVERISKADIVFATDWTSVYPVAASKAKNAKFYFVQDFEPWFEPVGSYQKFIERTYKLNFYGITAGRWLTEKLSTDYGMQCEYFNFGVDTDIYHDLGNTRRDICFYARPGSPRRGFEMGTLVLEQLQKRHPDLKIHCFGADLSRYDLPFTYIDHGVLKPQVINEVYNKCRAGLVFSFTNMSLMPQEMLASGCIPVINKADNNTKVFDNPNVAFVEAEVQKFVAACEELLYDKPASHFGKAAKNQGSGVWEQTWDNAEKFMLQKASK